MFQAVGTAWLKLCRAERPAGRRELHIALGSQRVGCAGEQAEVATQVCSGEA